MLRILVPRAALELANFQGSGVHSCPQSQILACTEVPEAPDRGVDATSRPALKVPPRALGRLVGEFAITVVWLPGDLRFAPLLEASIAIPQEDAGQGMDLSPEGPLPAPGCADAVFGSRPRYVGRP